MLSVIYFFIWFFFSITFLCFSLHQHYTCNTTTSIYTLFFIFDLPFHILRCQTRNRPKQHFVFHHTFPYSFISPLHRRSNTGQHGNWKLSTAKRIPIFLTATEWLSCWIFAYRRTYQRIPCSAVWSDCCCKLFIPLVLCFSFYFSLSFSLYCVWVCCAKEKGERFIFSANSVWDVNLHESHPIALTHYSVKTKFRGQLARLGRN